ncbi:MAG: hypothetical protein WCL44_11160 [bacterium]
MPEELKYTAVTHAHIRRILHPRLCVEVDGRSCVRYLRFRRRVKLDHLELPRNVWTARWEPVVPIHPAHITVSVLDGTRWRVVKDVEFPRIPLIAGDGVDSETSAEEMTERFKDLMAERLRIDLDGLETDHIRVECDREHQVYPNHTDMATGAAGYAVPFGILAGTAAYGEPLADRPDANGYYRPILKVGNVAPEAPAGMKARRHLTEVRFEGKRLSVGFSLRRPLITHLGWDAEGFGQAGRNRLVSRRLDLSIAPTSAGGASGPIVRTTEIDCGASHWTGEVSVEGNRVSYRNLRCAVEGIRFDAVFTVEQDRIVAELTQSADRDIPVLEVEAWRLAWDLKKGMTAAAAKPTLRETRAGDVEMPALFASDAVGCLSCRVLEGPADALRLQYESYRDAGVTTGGIVLSALPPPGAPLVISRTPVRAIIELAVANLQPVLEGAHTKVPPAIRKHWASTFASFRPEYGGFSNHAASTNCHVNQAYCIDVAVFTAKPAQGPDPIDLARFTIQRAILDGSGYGYFRNLYLDADPILMSAVGRIHQRRPDIAWLARLRPGLVETAQRLLATIGEEGLAVCRELSGNSGTHRMSSNAMDQIGFGHMDAYSNAWIYRALRNAGVLLRLTGDGDLAARCRDAAEGMREPFARFLINPETGWVAGWRSRDGRLHDAAYVFVNGPACAFGVLDRRAAKRALTGLEALRADLGLADCPFGLPTAMQPIPEADQPKRITEAATGAQVELFCNGAMVPGTSEYYIRALSANGMKANARKLARDMEEGYLSDVLSPGLSEGAEFVSWDGLASGYEGTFGPNFGTMYALAIERGLFAPPDPEWWPAEGAC